MPGVGKDKDTDIGLCQDGFGSKKPVHVPGHVAEVKLLYTQQCCQTYGFLRKPADFENFPHKSADFAFLRIFDNFERIFLNIFVK